MVSFLNPTVVVLSTFTTVGGWVCPSSSSVVRMGKNSLALRELVPISDSAAKEMSVLMI